MSDSSQFSGKVALVTGAGTGIGAATAKLLAERGAKVALAGLQSDALDRVVSEISANGGEAVALPTDVSDPAKIAQAVEDTVDRFGALHCAVNNAGVASENHDLPDLPLDVWDTTIGVNLSGVFYSMRAQLAAISQAGGGAIVNISSVFGDRGLPQRAAYTASKHGIRGLTRSVAYDWANRGVRVNEIQPGVIRTPMTDQGSAEENEAIKQSIAAKRVGDPREVATAVVFLLSDDASYITGAHLAVDGGFLI